MKKEINFYLRNKMKIKTLYIFRRGNKNEENKR